ncbi:MAG: Hsp20/alpha crystallin family protein, partial [Candidatus Korobacteraceae bacterium]
MTVLTRWDPFRELNALQQRMNRLFEEQYGGREESLTTGAFAPPVDVYEDEHSIQLKLEVPGIEEKDLDVKVENNVLTVSGERKFE